MLGKKDKTLHRLPTVDEFLRYRPRRLDFEWYTNEERLVRIKVPKFKSNFGKSFCHLLHRDNIFVAHLDDIGSLVWTYCDGKNTVKKILKFLKNELPEQKNIEQRLILFLQQMKKLNYITY